ncbi:hypothetical protein CFE70_003224 [Pyrenophora teres f. teres 0-1]
MGREGTEKHREFVLSISISTSTSTSTTSSMGTLYGRRSNLIFMVTRDCKVKAKEALNLAEGGAHSSGSRRGNTAGSGSADMAE